MVEMEVSLNIDEKEIKRRLGILADRSDAVMARAINRAGTAGKTAIARAAKKRYRLNAGDVNDRKVLSVRRAHSGNPEMTLTYKDRHRNLYLWKEQALKPRTIIHWQHGKPNVAIYKASVVKSHGMTPLGGRNKPFIQRVRKGENAEFVGLFRRKTPAADAALEGVSAASYPQLLKHDTIMKKFRETAGPILVKRLDKEIENILEGNTR